MTRHGSRLLTLAAAIVAASSASASGATFAVNSTADSADPNTADNVCNDAGVCTLRAAIQQANATAGADVILFDLGGSTIVPGSPLPDVTDTVRIDTEPGDADFAPLITLDGANQDAPGLTFLPGAGGSTVTGLGFERWGQTGLIAAAANVTVQRSWFGVGGVSGTTARPNGFGILVTGDNPSITDNVIAANTGLGLKLSGVTGGTIRRNLVGLGSDGSTVRPNSSGIVLDTGTTGVTVGGPGNIDRNVVSGNTLYGIAVWGGSHDNAIASNYVGTDAFGNVAKANLVGVYLSEAKDNVVKGIPQAPSLIAGNTQTGVLLQSATTTGNRVTGNWIGLRAAGTALPNQTGVRIDGEATQNVIGAGNVISGNSGTGVVIGGAGANRVVGNTIGLDVDGSAPRPNNAGVQITSGAAGNVIGGATPADRNIIAGNTGNGVSVTGILSPGNKVLGNWIGLSANGLVRPNGVYGVDVGNDADGTVVGAPGAGNVIGGNIDAGISVTGSSTSGTVIQANLIGLDAEGDDKAGNGGDGIRINGAAGTLIGGGAAGAGNVIAGQPGAGILLSGSSGSIVAGNRIGTTSDGSRAVGNGLGISVAGSAVQETIGGTDAGLGNVISGNVLDGVEVATSAARTSIRGNAIFANGALAIDLRSPAGGDGITANDDLDADTGANALQNFPVLVSAVRGAASTSVAGTINSTAGSELAVDLYASGACDASGNGEAQHYVGSTTVATDSGGNGSFTAAVAGLAVGDIVTATATSALGATSEVSACLTVTAAPAAPSEPQSSPPPAPAPPAAPLAARLRAAGRQAPLRTRALVAALRTNLAAGYRVTARVTIAGRDRAMALGPLRGKTRPKTTRELRFSLTSRQLRLIRRALADGRKVVARFSATITASGEKLVRRARSAVVAAAGNGGGAS